VRRRARELLDGRRCRRTWPHCHTGQTPLHYADAHPHCVTSVGLLIRTFGCNMQLFKLVCGWVVVGLSAAHMQKKNRSRFEVRTRNSGVMVRGQRGYQMRWFAPSYDALIIKFLRWHLSVNRLITQRLSSSFMMCWILGYVHVTTFLKRSTARTQYLTYHRKSVNSFEYGGMTYDFHSGSPSWTLCQNIQIPLTAVRFFSPSLMPWYLFESGHVCLHKIITHAFSSTFIIFIQLILLFP
jgi:hypothetical protein